MPVNLEFDKIELNFEPVLIFLSKRTCCDADGADYHDDSIGLSYINYEDKIIYDVYDTDCQSTATFGSVTYCNTMLLDTSAGSLDYEFRLGFEVPVANAFFG